MSGTIQNDLEYIVEKENIRPWWHASAAPEPPILSVLIVRWWDYASDQRKSEYKITSEFAVRTFVENSGLTDLLGNRFEIFSVFVKTSQELDAFDPQIVFDKMQGFHKCGFYYLWPAQKTDAHNISPGMVEERKFFSLMERCEHVGISTRYPAPAHLYHQILGKHYYDAACLNRDLQTPVTTRVYGADIKASPLKAARDAVHALNSIRHQVYGTIFLEL